MWKALSWHSRQNTSSKENHQQKQQKAEESSAVLDTEQL